MYTKLSNLVDQVITIQEIGLPVWKIWNPELEKIETSNEPKKGYAKKYAITTDKGIIELGTGQLGSILESVICGSSAELLGASLEIKSNGKSGKDIRYFFNQVKTENRQSSVKTNEDMPF